MNPGALLCDSHPRGGIALALPPVGEGLNLVLPMSLSEDQITHWISVGTVSRAGTQLEHLATWRWADERLAGSMERPSPVSTPLMVAVLSFYYDHFSFVIRVIGLYKKKKKKLK